METALIALAAYALGSVSFAIVVSRLMRLPDPRSYGSKNPGAANVLRTGSRSAAALALLGDAGKGWLAVSLAGLLAGNAAFAALAVFLGHLYPVFHRFRGGKGVATAAGILFAFDWRIGLGALATWLIIAAFFRYASLASLVAAAFAPFFTALLLGLDAGAAAVLVISVLLAWRHKDNIARLLAGTEPRIGRSTTS